MFLAPIIIFVYNRLWHTRQTVEALKKNLLAKDSKLFIFSDGSKNEEDIIRVREVREYIKTIIGFKRVTITERENNLGLANSIITGVTEIVNKYGKIIVLEDDLLTSSYFLKFMNEGLNFYEKEKRIASIHGYVYPVKGKLPETFFLKDPGCLGWATWKRGWDLFKKDGNNLLEEIKHRNLTANFDYNNSYPFTDMLKDQINDKVDSWAIRWYASVFLNNKLTLYPGRSLVFHNGDDGSGTNSRTSTVFNVKLYDKAIKIKNIPVEESFAAWRKYVNYFESIKPSFLFSLGRNLKRKFIYSIGL